MGPKKARGKRSNINMELSIDSEKSSSQVDKKEKDKKKGKKQKEIKKFRWTRIVKSEYQLLPTINTYDGLEDLIESEQVVLDDKCHEIKPFKLQFHPEAFEEENWE